jgi:hypothetical protein
MNKDLISKLTKEDLYKISLNLNEQDIKSLVEYLNEKDDDIRYKSSLILQYITDEKDDLYKYWELFEAKLTDKNAYQRMLGLIFIARLTKWDIKDKMSKTLDNYLSLLNDEKPITVRICIQNLEYVLKYKENTYDRVIEKLYSMDILKVKETMRRVIVIDILNIFKIIKSNVNDSRIDKYYNNIMNSSIFDEKVKKEFKKIIESN